MDLSAGPLPKAGIYWAQGLYGPVPKDGMGLGPGPVWAWDLDAVQFYYFILTCIELTP